MDLPLCGGLMVGSGHEAGSRRAEEPRESVTHGSSGRRVPRQASGL